MHRCRLLVDSSNQRDSYSIGARGAGFDGASALHSATAADRDASRRIAAARNGQPDPLSGTSRNGRGTAAPGPSKCHHSPE